MSLYIIDNKCNSFVFLYHILSAFIYKYYGYVSFVCTGDLLVFL